MQSSKIVSNIVLCIEFYSILKYTNNKLKAMYFENDFKKCLKKLLTKVADLTSLFSLSGFTTFQIFLESVAIFW